VDYALFIVTRFRADLRDGMPPRDAVVTAMHTAGRAVLTAGTTVVIGMLVLRQPLLNGVAIAAAATVAMTVVAALTLLPALLSFTGTRLARPSRVNTFLGGKVFDRGRTGRHADGTAASTPDRPEKAERMPAAQRWAGVVQRHPVLAAVLSAACILALAAPALAIKLSFPDESGQARGTMGYASYATMAQGFGPGFDAPLIVAAKVPPSGEAALTALRGAIAATPGIAGVTPPVISRDGQAAMLIAYPTTGEQDAATNALVNRLQDTVLPGSGLTAYLTGPNAANVSFADLIGTRLPVLIGVIVALSMVLLLVVFRSVVIAVKAAVMNLLSICAAYGVLVAVTQWAGWGTCSGFRSRCPSPPGCRSSYS
jgi:RND superfamily putative drug exporter